MKILWTLNSEYHAPLKEMCIVMSDVNAVKDRPLVQIVAEILLNAEKTQLFVAMFVNYVLIVLKIKVSPHLRIFEDQLK